MNPYNVIREAHAILANNHQVIERSAVARATKAEILLETALLDADDYAFALRQAVWQMANASMQSCKVLETIPILLQNTKDILYKNFQTAKKLDLEDYYLTVLNQMCNGYCKIPTYTKEA